MAVVSSTTAKHGGDQGTRGLGAYLVTWAALPNGDTGTPFEDVTAADRTVQVTGTFGIGGSVNLEGSLDGTNYKVLTDPQGNALTFTAAGIEAVTEITKYIRPNVTAGDGSTSLTITVMLRRPYYG